MEIRQLEYFLKAGEHKNLSAAARELFITEQALSKSIVALEKEFGFSLFVPILLVNFTGLPGAVIGYLIVMCILLVLLVWEYGKVRMALAERDKQAAAAHATRVVGRVVSTEDASAERERRSRDASAELRTSRTPRR